MMNTQMKKYTSLDSSSAMEKPKPQKRRKSNSDQQDYCENLQPREKEYREPMKEVLGLYLRVQSKGKKSWQYRYRKDGGKWCWCGLGTFPQVSYEEAKDLAKDFESGNKEIKSKTELRKEAKEEKEALFSSVIYEWLESKRDDWTEQTYRKEKQSIEKHLIPVFGNRLFKEIASKEWLKFFKEKQRNEKIYNRIDKLVSNCEGAYIYAKFKDQVKNNPLTGIRKHLSKGPSQSMKHVSESELPELIRKVRAYSSRSISIAIELLMHMFPRPQELRFAKWEQFDFQKKLWIRPADVMKRRVQHAIPLSSQVISLLEELKRISIGSPYLFPGRQSTHKPISEQTLNRAINGMGYRHKQTPHGFRHIASTILNENFSQKDQVIEAALAHLKGGVKGAYDKAVHLDERRELMQWWSNHIEALS